ncbi:MAG TPA: endonuclease III [Thermoplasmata archaeon]|nr:endonuclease III [Thermoplasmata archaeon]
MTRARSGAEYPWEQLLDELSALYGTGDWRVPYLRDHAEDPFQVLIGTILSQRTRDANTDKASAALFAKYPDARTLAAAKPRDVEPLIRATGFYRTKSRLITATAREILERFGGAVPRDVETLTTLPGVGPKTANCVRVFGYGLPGMPVDTHVHRIANRLGVVRTKTPEATEEELRRVVPERFWIPINPLLVQHGQNLCRPRRPLCGRCPIVELCATGRALRDHRPPPRREDAPGRPRTPRPSRSPPPRMPRRRSRPRRTRAT